ncbi:MAG: molybdate ABC transporter substrate-binding protein [Rhodobiaceae bacterium]|nr:molybdate ABC transporter substrate-binding protein [Paracoccaceae bacterium]MCB1472552.1 molybdate ABC transporter substrate-binding protein [Rhodobiaceae bacterium]MCC0015639.1 molybdate ABC transporter substrate-binding protein [Rhodobiaceae bacterium]MCC0042535.1 molybdate ABC transporter substrate-binding protein [Rhodobiaceae bacterium]
MRFAPFLVLAALVTSSPAAAADDVILFAAGSLKAALGDVAKAFTAATGTGVVTQFGPSGLMRERIEGGEVAHVFASANMKHPKTLADAGRAGPVTMFARNKLCAIAQPEVSVSTDTILDTMLEPDIRVGTSTPKSDPAGDYAFALFGKADALKAGATATLEAKALKLTGATDSTKPPEGRNPYGWVMSEKKADIFLTYCTNALLAQKDSPGLQIVQIPEALSVGADYGLTVVSGAPAAGQALADFILSRAGQDILASYGFSTGTGN